MSKRVVFMMLFLLSVILVGNAYSEGSGGYRLEIPSAAAMGKGSAFVAQADDPSAVYYNPAGLTQLKGNTYFSVGAGAIQPFTTFIDGAGKGTDMHEQVFVIPHGYAVADFGLKKLAFGIGTTSTWGLGTQWANDSFSRYSATKSNLIAQNTMFTGAYEVNDNLSIGLGADDIRAWVKKRKAIYNGSGVADGESELEGRDNNSWGYRVSTLYKLNPKHSFGLMYRSPVNVEYKGKLHLSGLTGTSAFLMGGSTFETDVLSKSRLPQSVVFGYCFKPDSKWRFEADAEWMDWRSVKQEMIYYPSIPQGDVRRNVLDAGNPISRNWNEVMSYAFGSEYKLNDQWKLRAGYFYHQTPVPQGTFDTALPDATSNSATLGFGYNLTKNVTFDFAYSAMFYNDRKIDQAVNTSNGTNIDGTYRSFDNLYVATVTFKI